MKRRYRMGFIGLVIVETVLFSFFVQMMAEVFPVEVYAWCTIPSNMACDEPDGRIDYEKCCQHPGYPNSTRYEEKCKPGICNWYDYPYTQKMFRPCILSASRINKSCTSPGIPEKVRRGSVIRL